MHKILRRFRQRDILKLPNHCGKMPGAPCLRWMIRTYTINRFQCPYVICNIYVLRVSSIGIYIYVVYVDMT